MTQFDIKSIEPEWFDLLTEFKEFFLEPSEEVLSLPKMARPQNVDHIVNLRFGFECGIGWKQIIWEYCTELRQLIAKAKENGDEIQYKGFIFKEKFGELVDQGTFSGKDRKKYLNEYYDLQSEYGAKSIKTCERCGRAGSLASTNAGDTLRVVCSDATGGAEVFRVLSFVGNITVV